MEHSMVDFDSDVYEELLRNIADLKELRILQSDFMSRHSEIVCDVVRKIAEVREGDRNKLRLKTLCIPGSSLTGSEFEYDEAFETLLDMPLEEFTGKVYDFRSLKPYSDTLQYMHGSITRTSDMHSPPLNTKIVLPHLNELHVDGLISQVIKNLNVLESPNLEILSFKVYSPEQARLLSFNLLEKASIKIANPSFKNVMRLECCTPTETHACCILDIDDYKSLSESMPNVKHAKLSVTPGAFQELCRKWPNLLTLTIADRFGTYTKIGDETLTGVRRYSDGSNRAPNITDLKLLTDFEYSGSFGDHAVKFGFLQMPRLYYLCVRFSQISEEVKAELLKKVQVVVEM